MVEKQMKMASLLFLLNYRLIYPQCLFLKTDSFISRIKIGKKMDKIGDRKSFEVGGLWPL